VARKLHNPKVSNDQAFNAWLAKVDVEIGKICGLSHTDLPDQTWRDWFDSEMTPAEAARETLENEGFPFEDE
jgi:hypothetical protein